VADHTQDAPAASPAPDPPPHPHPDPGPDPGPDEPSRQSAIPARLEPTRSGPTLQPSPPPIAPSGLSLRRLWTATPGLSQRPRPATTSDPNPRPLPATTSDPNPRPLPPAALGHSPRSGRPDGAEASPVAPVSDSPGDRTTRITGAAAGIAILVGALTMLVALVAVPGPWLRGYVSEAGTAEMPFAAAYRCGLILLALGVGLLGLALRRSSRLVAVLLGAAGATAATSGAVRCSSQCPLPPFEPTTVSDVVHAAASIVGMVVLAGAMAMIALSSVWRPAARRLAAGAAALTFPLGGVLGLTMLFVGRDPVGAVLERLVLTVAVSWLIGTSLLTILRSSVKVEPCSRQNPIRSSTASRSSNANSPS